MSKPSIVFCHGIWADGSCFSKLIGPLQAEGYQVIAAQYGLDDVEEDVAAVKRTLGRVSSPALLVGHSYGGTVITAAGADPRVAGLVYIAALAPDQNETSASQQQQFPVTEIFSLATTSPLTIPRPISSARPKRRSSPKTAGAARSTTTSSPRRARSLPSSTGDRAALP